MSSVGRFQRLAHRLFGWYEFSKRFTNKKRQRAMSPLAVHTSIMLFWNGFFPEKYLLLYELQKNDWKLFASDRHMLMSRHIDGDHAVILYDKVLFELVMSRFANVPRNFALIDHGNVVWLANVPKEKRDFAGLVKQEGKVILKPRKASGGRGVRLLEFREGSYWHDGQPVNEEGLTEAFRKYNDVIVVEHVRQGPFAEKLYPKTVNTIRLLTMLDPKSHAPFVAAACLRVGCARSIPRDNFSSGGMVCNIDLASGRLSTAVMAGTTDISFQWIDRHPETEVVFQEQVIPDWGGICEKILDLAGKFSMLPYVAWDIAMLDNGISVIEGNHWSDWAVFQFDRPLLADHRIRKFFRYHNVL